MNTVQEETWMALPLFNRQPSPDHTREVFDKLGEWDDHMGAEMMPTFDYEDYGESPMQYTQHYAPATGSYGSDYMYDYNGELPVLTDSTTASSTSSRPQSRSLSLEYFENAQYYGFREDEGGPSKGGELLDEISDEHIPQPHFSSPSICPFPGCKSTAVFTTGRDFRRHYRQHFKRFFCRYEECSQSTQDPMEAGKKGFSTRKDRARHEAKHNPAIKCPWQDANGEQCTRTFSRMDNMKDHYRRIHEKR